MMCMYSTGTRALTHAHIIAPARTLHQAVAAPDAQLTVLCSQPWQRRQSISHVEEEEQQKVEEELQDHKEEQASTALCTPLRLSLAHTHTHNSFLCVSPVLHSHLADDHLHGR